MRIKLKDGTNQITLYTFFWNQNSLIKFNYIIQQVVVKLLPQSFFENTILCSGVSVAFFI
jgi:hypothetical protein